MSNNILKKDEIINRKWQVSGIENNVKGKNLTIKFKKCIEAGSFICQ
jgi:hypothetical protein